MSQLKVESLWRTGLRCDVSMGDFEIVVDEPESVGGTNLGPQPTDLFLASIASCFTLAIAYSAKKRAIELGSLKVDVTGTYDGPGFSSIFIDCNLGCSESEIEGLLLAAKRVCYVTNTIRSQVDITIEASNSVVSEIGQVKD